MKVMGRGWRRDFLGFNRARAAIIEAAIMATRLHFLGQARVMASLQNCETIVLKTGEEAEWRALQRLRDYVRGWPNEVGG